MALEASRGALEFGLGLEPEMAYGELGYIHRLSENAHLFARGRGGWLFESKRPYGELVLGGGFTW